MNILFKRLNEIETKTQLVQMALAQHNRQQQAADLKERNRQRKEIDLPPLAHDVYLSERFAGFTCPGRPPLLKRP